MRINELRPLSHSSNGLAPNSFHRCIYQQNERAFCFDRSGGEEFTAGTKGISSRTFAGSALVGVVLVVALLPCGWLLIGAISVEAAPKREEWCRATERECMMWLTCAAQTGRGMSGRARGRVNARPTPEGGVGPWMGRARPPVLTAGLPCQDTSETR